MTHTELCELGAKYLKSNKNYRFRCQYVVVEFTTLCNEQPDVYGYRGGCQTVLLEVKMSRSDFKADKKKLHRAEDNGIGSSRYYLCPTNLISIDELPDKWGLLYCDDGRISVVKMSEQFDKRDYVDEMSVMYSIIRRTNKAQIFDFKKK